MRARILATAFVVAIVSLCAQGQNKATRISGGFSTGAGYHLFDVGNRATKDQVFTQWIGFEHDLTEKNTIVVNTWGQYGSKKKSAAEEFDIGGAFIRKLTLDTSIAFSAALFKVRGLSIGKFATKISRKLKKLIPLTLENELSYFRTTRPDLVKGGVVNKTTLAAPVSLPNRFTVLASVGLGLDNGPFKLGGPAGILFLQGRVERPLSAHWSVFAGVKHSRPFVGKTRRTDITSAEIGIKFFY